MTDAERQPKQVADTGAIRVLVLDDDELLSLMLAERLRQEKESNYSVEVTTTAAEAR